jgi:tetratricopeptide (TPR) repeat protein
MNEEPDAKSQAPRWSRLLDHAAAVNAVVAVLVFLQSLAGDFVFDDTLLVADNEYVHAWRWLPRAFSTHFWDVSRTADVIETRRYYRPLVTSSYLVTWMIAGARPWAFHLGNVLLHGTAAALATRAAVRWTRSSFWGLTVGLAFAIHPSRTENVTWISGRTDVLMLVFVLAALEAFRTFVKVSTRPWGWLAFAGGMVATTAGLLSKEPATMLPLLLLADGALGTTRQQDERRRFRVAFIAATGACAANVLARMFFLPGSEAVHTLTPVHCLMTVGAYVQRVVVPWPPTMYYHTLAFDDAGPLYPTPLVALGVTAIVAWVVALVVAWRRSRTAFWLLVATAAFMGPLLNLYFTGMNVSAQDRFLYAPLLLGTAGLVALGHEHLEHLSRRRATHLVVLGLALLWAVLVNLRAFDYRDNRSFWESELRHNPTNPYVLENLAFDAASRGELLAAHEYLRRAEAPECRKYRLIDDRRSHFRHAVILAALLPDGRVEELRALLDELWRVIEPAKVPARRSVLGFEVGGPVDDLDRLRVEGAIHRDIALIATRVGEFERAEHALQVAATKEQVSSVNPLNDALTLARLGRISEAWALHQRIAEHPDELGRLVTARDLRDFAERLRRAEQLAVERDSAENATMRTTFEALRRAELGAYLAALLVLEGGGVLEVPEVTPLVLQLLVACRLDDAARAFAAQHVSAESGDDIVQELREALPPRLRGIPPVPGDLRSVLARAAAP